MQLNVQTRRRWWFHRLRTTWVVTASTQAVSMTASSMCRRFRQRSDRRVANEWKCQEGEKSTFLPFETNLPANGRTQPNLAETRETGQAQDKVHTDNSEIERLVAVIGKEQMSVKMMMEKLQLKGRDNFLRLYLFPALEEGFVTLLYPDKPRYPRQKYLLTVKGLALLSEL